MRSVFSEWYPLSDNERTLVLETGVIVLDTSALLTLYGMSVPDRGRVLDLLSALEDRLWMPYRVGEEFQRNRLKVYNDQLRAYDDLQGKISKLRNQIVDSFQAHPVLTQRDVRSEIAARLGALKRYIEEQRERRHPTDLTDPLIEDGVRSALDRIFEGRVGEPVELTKEMLDEAERRFEQKIPPGYEDAKKPIPDRYGDYFVWMEAVSRAAGVQGGPSPLLFVTEDSKPDWWLFDPDKKHRIGPRPELVKEAATDGVKPLLVVSLRRFFSTAAQHLGWEEQSLGDYAPVDEVGLTAEKPRDENASDEQPEDAQTNGVEAP